MKLVKSKQRVADHGEVFTPGWLVEDMLDLVQNETQRIDSRFLEPATGSGNFLVPVLERKLNSVETRYGTSDFERKHYALFALMCIYGIELLVDNLAECKSNLLGKFEEYLKVESTSIWAKAAKTVVDANIVQGNALKMTTIAGLPIQFPEWGYLGKGKYQRSDFLYDNLTRRGSYRDTLFEQFEDREIFTPIKTYRSMNVEEIARLGTEHGS